MHVGGVVSGGRLLGSGLKLRQLGIDKQRLHLWLTTTISQCLPGESRRPGPRILIGRPYKTLVKPIQGTGGVGIRVVGDSLPGR